MKIAITGASGVIGSELVKRGCIPLNCDITKPYDITAAISIADSDVVIHCAAITDVKYCEDHFQESFDVNVRGTMNVVNAMPQNALLIYLSSDHVFSGHQYFDEGYGEWQKPSPVNRYGFSKWGGEEMVKTATCPYIIVRSSKLFNFEWAKPIINQLEREEKVEVTDIIKRSFLHVNHFVDSLFKLIELRPNINLLNISGSSISSYYMFWNFMQRELGLPGKVVPRMHELEEECPRPFRGGLDIRKAKKLGLPIYSIKDGAKLLADGI